MLQRVVKVSSQDEKLNFVLYNNNILQFIVTSQFNGTYQINNVDSELPYPLSTNETLNLFYIDCIFI